jgi:precorrin-3B methylase
MVIRMENAERLSLAQMEALVATSQEVRFVGEGKAEIYAWAEKVLVEQEYAAQGKKGRGVVRRTWPN